VLLTVLGAWLVCAVLVAIVFAAIGRSALREDRALGHPPPDREDGVRAGERPAPEPAVPANPLSR